MADVKFTPGPWHLCQHLKSVEDDRACSCGYRGVIYGPEHDVAYAICQPGHDPAPTGQEGSEPPRYPREVELANAALISASPDLYDALAEFVREYEGFEDGEGNPCPTIGRAKAALAKAEGRS